MARTHLLRLWLALALLVVLGAAAALWLRGARPDSTGPSTSDASSALRAGSSALPSPLATSPLPTPTLPSTATPPSPWITGAAALLWVMLGIALALGIAFLVLRMHHHDTGRRSE
jgi:hypothetical protein